MKTLLNLKKIYSGNITNITKIKIITFISIALEIIPFFIFIDEIVFPARSTNILTFLLFFMSPEIWLRYIEIGLNSTEIDYSNMCASNNNYTITTDINLPQMTSYIELIQPTVANYYTNIYQNSSNLLSYLVYVLLFIIFFSNTLPTLDKNNLVNKIAINLTNSVLRHFLIIILMILGNDIVNSLYFLQSGLIMSSISIIIGISLILFCLNYIKYMCSFYYDYPYDFKSADLDLSFFYMKIIMSIAYNFYKIRMICNNIYARNIYLFLCLIFILIILIQFTIITMNFKNFISFNFRFNFYRYCLCLYLIIFILYKFIEYFYDLYTCSLNTLLIICYLLICYLLTLYILRYISNLNFLDKDMIYEFLLIAEEYLALLKKENRNKVKQYNKFKLLLLKKIFIHKQIKKCNLKINTDCLLCIDKDKNMTDSNFTISTKLDSLINSIFENFLESSKYSENILDYNLLKIQSFNILTHFSNQNSTLFLFEIYNKLNNKIDYRQKLLYEFLLSNLTLNKSANIISSQNNSNNEKLLIYFEINQEYEMIINNAIKSIQFLNNYMKVKSLFKIAYDINKARKKIKNTLIKLNTEKTNFNHLQVSFHYKTIFNRNYHKNFGDDDFNNHLEFIEDNFQKINHFFLEFNSKEKNLKIKTVALNLLNEIKCEMEFLKNQNISSIFPSYLSKIQIKKIIEKIENNSNNKDNFILKLLIKDTDTYIKYFYFKFKIIIDVNLKIFLVAEYKNVSKNQNLLVLNQRGDIISISESFVNNFLNGYYTHQMRNFFDISKIQKDKLFSSDVNIKILKKAIIKEEILTNTENDNINNKFGSKVNSDIKDNDFINISLKENIPHGNSIYYLYNFTKLDNHLNYQENEVINKNKDLRTKLNKNKINDEEEAVMTGDENLNTITNSYNEAIIWSEISSITQRNSTQSSVKSKFNNEDNMPIIIKNNLNLYHKIKEKKTLTKIEYSIYIFNFLLIIIGLSFLFYFNNILSLYSILFNGMYKFRSIRAQISVQLLILVKRATIAGDNANNYYLNNSIFNDDNFKLKLPIYQNVVISQKYSDLKIFLDQIKGKDQFYDILVNTKVNYTQIDMDNKKFVVKSDYFIQIMDLLLAHFQNLEGLLKFNTNLNPDEFENSSDNQLFSIFFIFQNFFPVFFRYFTSISSYMTNTLVSYVDYLMSNIIIYNIFYVASHFVIITITCFYLTYIFYKFKNIFTFLDNFDKKHLDYIEKKMKFLKQSIDFVITPRKLIKNLKKENNSKELIKATKNAKIIKEEGINTINFNNNNNDKIKLDLEPLKSTITTQIKNLLFTNYLKYILILLVFTLGYFSISILIFNFFFRI